MENERSPDWRFGKSPKTVSIADIDGISPLMRGTHKAPEAGEDPLNLDHNAKQFSAGLGSRRLQGRPAIERVPSRQSTGEIAIPEQLLSEVSSRPQSQQGHDGLITQISAWIKHEKERRAARKAKAKASKHGAREIQAATADDHDEETADEDSAESKRRESDVSEGTAALDELAAIVERSSIHKDKPGHRRTQHLRRMSSTKLRRGTQLISSDTDVDPDVFVPHADVVLDNSKTLAYSGGAAETSDESMNAGKLAARDREAWTNFKYEIVRLAHTLRLKSWRRVPLESSNEIDVERLSGALTNAVYLVKPPKNLPAQEQRYDEAGNMLPQKKHPPELLLRIYGPQVEHLIDRESELQILRRLRRKNIGPRLLGTFSNGRFEEFLHSRTLKAEDLRVPETSKQIAKRMRELHEGVDLLPQEREEGPFVWKNWIKWVDRCEQIVTWLDRELANTKPGQQLHKSESWKQRGFVVGTEWRFFKATVEKYRKWLEEQYGGMDKIQERMVFAHNDTQYGNILRLIPPGESPLLLPANEHKQLVVIDFEYASANLPGYEFANHFTEWCYNYHDPVNPHSINVSMYPDPVEQRRFIRAYVLHRPAFSQISLPPTPSLGPTNVPSFSTSSSNISSFMLDSRAPPAELKKHLENEDDATNREVDRLMAETRVWRAAASIKWVAWGVVQAKIPGLPDLEQGSDESGTETSEDVTAKTSDASSKEEGASNEQHDQRQPILMSDPPTEEAKNASQDFAAKRPDGLAEPEEEEEEEFDYLAYAQERVMLFWGDMIRLGIVSKQDLPETIRDKIAILDY